MRKLVALSLILATAQPAHAEWKTYTFRDLLSPQEQAEYQKSYDEGQEAARALVEAAKPENNPDEFTKEAAPLAKSLANALPALDDPLDPQPSLWDRCLIHLEKFTRSVMRKISKIF